ncbi:hypothetical protein JXA32_10155 [Candidatus Sumerlaeota bacterium]|nr:hypothetical protein [Candidatus Sumerlaeota bacterium]
MPRHGVSVHSKDEAAREKKILMQRMRKVKIVLAGSPKDFFAIDARFWLIFS